ncbi:MAG: sugar ABC transporter ATP-binding protein [Cyanobacteria bacterium]|nr:sugar ABC transporter ATP-binding protein [Cyanobacteriota bacterium]
MNFKLEFKEINKSFPGVQALKDISFGIYPATVHCLVGENGAGKSTLIKILSGAYQKDSGEIIIDGKHVDIESPREAQQLKIGFIYQEQNLLNNLTVGENITLGTEKRKFGLIDKRKDLEVVTDILEKLSLEIDCNSLVSNLGVAEKQLVAIAKALHLKNNIIVMDEASEALTFEEQKKLFDIISDLKSSGVTILYISHNLSEIFEIGDYVSVLRDGMHISTVRVDKVNKDELIKMMVGKNLFQDSYKKPVKSTECILSIKNLSRHGKLKSISFDVYSGEIVGFYGLTGAGRTELARIIFGADSFDEGEIYVNGKSFFPGSPSNSLKNGISLIPEDRREQGVIEILDVSTNIYITSIKSVSAFGVVMNRKVSQLARNYIEKLKIKTPSLNQQVKFLSGGNQQKIVVSKILNTNPKILLMDEPTRGIDVGAKSEIFQLMRELADSGVTIIMFSSELSEIISICNRIFVMYRGKLTKEFSSEDVSQDKILYYATGGI